MGAEYEALKAQVWEAAAGVGVGEAGRRARGFVGGDFEGMLKLLGLSGASGTYPCMFCLAHHTGTLKAGVPQLEAMPRGFEALDTRPIEQRVPPLRDVASLLRESAAYLAATESAAASGGAPPAMGSTEYHNSTGRPIVGCLKQYVLMLMSGGPLHCDLGI